MNPASKTLLLAIGALFLTMGCAFASTSDLFSTVPLGDPTYDKLSQLEQGGFLPLGSSKKLLTRYEVAQFIWKAQRNYDAIVVAAGDMVMPPSAPSEKDNSSPNPTSTPKPGEMTLPPSAASTNDYAIPLPPSEGQMADKTAASAEALPAAPTPKPTPNYNLHPELLKTAEDDLKSLDETYELELQVVIQDKSIVLEDLAKAEASQYDLWKQVKNLRESPHLSVSGKGRMYGISQQYWGSYAGNPFQLLNSGDFQPLRRSLSGYVELKAEMAVSKQLQWEAIWRFTTSNLPSAQPSIDFTTPLDGYWFRRLAVEFSPDFMTSSFGDFYEAYTPLTLWNRNTFDIFYKPEPFWRWDDDRKYDNYYNNEPYWPLRGVRVGTAVGWPESEFIDRFQFSVFAHMLNLLTGTRSKGTGSVIGASNASPPFTQFLIGAQAELKTKKLWTEDIAWMFKLDGYEVILDKIPDVPGGNTKYDPNDYRSWLNQYRITSICPELKAGFTGDIYLGVQYEAAVASYQADKFNSGRTTVDFASMIRPFFQIEESKIAFNVLTVYPYYYSPMAQLRQDYPSGNTSYVTSADLFTPPLNDQFLLLASVRRAERLYGYYDRTQDNVMPYGLATPNRQGFGLDADIKSVPDKALKVGVSAYLLSEISGNLVVNSLGNGYTAVDSPPSGATPIRNFVYVNVGPSYDFGSLIGLTTPIEFGFNFRDEETTSQAGNLSSLWVLGGTRIGLFPWWEVTAAIGDRKINGSEMGINGSVFARYSYIYNNEDLGLYKPFTVNNADIQNWLISMAFKLDDHSKLDFDYSMTMGNNAPNYGSILGAASALPAALNNQYMEMTYEVKF
jgi:hypothetical protein